MSSVTAPQSLLSPGTAKVLAHLNELKLKSPPNDGLAELHIELTHACNLKCPMCHHWRLKPLPRGVLLDAKSLGSVLESTRRLDKIKVFTLTGGEPFLRPDFTEMAVLLHKRFPQASLGVLSNFQDPKLVRRRLLELQDAGIRELWLGSSLDGIGAMHDRMRGVKGAYDNLLATTAMLQAEFPKINFGFNFTLTPVNAEQLFDVWLVAAAKKLWLGAQLVVNQEDLPAENYSWDGPAIDLVAGQIEKVIDHICHAERAYELIKTGRMREKPWLWTQLAYWSKLRSYARRPQRLFSECGAGRRYAMLAPDGELFFCPVKKHLTVGNARELGFDKAWNSAKAKKLRAVFALKKCHCWLHCIANPILEQSFGGQK